MRVVIPFVIWLFMYAVLPGLWGEFSNEEVKNNLSHIFINFIPRASHLWFIYILLGIYLIMPVLMRIIRTSRCCALEHRDIVY